MNEFEASSTSQHIALAFSTLIGRFMLPELEQLNSQLQRILLEREATTPSQDYANQGGWHSPADLLEWPYPEIAQLRVGISHALTQMVQATGQLPEVKGRAAPPKGSFQVSAWGNIARRGQYHRMHNHPGSAWSGVYYVTSVSDDQCLSGVLELYDPRPFTEMVNVPGSPYGQRLLVRPVPGLMVMFPSWLYHFVHPSDREAERISIAFNASWQPG